MEVINSGVTYLLKNIKYKMFFAYLVPVSMFSVSVRRGRRRTRPQSVPVDPAGLLAPGLLLRPSLNSVMRGTDCVLTLAQVTCTLVVWSNSVSDNGELKMSEELCGFCSCFHQRVVTPQGTGGE